MTLLKIARLGEPVLRRAARAVTAEELASSSLQQLLDDMLETMRDASGAGLAAPQVYRSLQLVVMEVGDNPRYPGVASLPLTFLVNPVVTSLVGPEPLTDEHAISVYEGCLSVPGLRGRVRRPRRVRVRALGRDASPVDFELEGFLAAVVQHEVDHLHGSLFIDRALPGTLAFQAEYERHVPPEQRVVDGKRPPPAFP